jgi:putative resolvase
MPYGKDKKEKDYISIGEASKQTGLGIQAIRNMVDKEKIRGYKTPSGHRKIHRECLQKMLHNNQENSSGNRRNFLYTRVSTRKQMDDLSRQIEYVSRPEYDGYHLISDIGSGINFKRKGLQTLLDRCIQGDIGEVVVAHRDRLSRFGFELIESIISKAGGKITVLDSDERFDEAKELSDDLLAIIHVFSCKQMGRRSYKVKNSRGENDKDKDISK